MNIRVAWSSILLVIFVSGCMGMKSVTPQDAARIRQLAGSYQTQTVKNLGSSGESRTPPRAGQWVALLSSPKSDPNNLTLQIMKIASLNGNNATIEIEQYSASEPGKRFVLQQRIRNYPVKAKTVYTMEETADNLSQMQIESIKVMDETGQVSDIPQLPFAMGRLASDLIRNNVATGDIRKEPCGNDYIKASSCYVVPYQTKILWRTESGTSYAHSGVPIVGFISSEGTDSRVDVIGFGSGAQILIK